VPVVGSVNDALCFNPTTALVGVATQGGRFPPEWIGILKSCIAKGLDIENGLHVFLADDPELAELAARNRVELRDLRRPPSDLSTATGANLEVPATIVLTVGSDCAIGKMTVSLELDREARSRGLRSLFVPASQTGIAIAGWGIAVDAVVADFIAQGGGAARRRRERAERASLVEGRARSLHPVYSGVARLYHGAVPAPARPVPRSGSDRDRGGGWRASRSHPCATSWSFMSGSHCPSGRRRWSRSR
jgi:uncharacterized NAD-dependent epimerase/dehydratase family protein